jgi:hypothetical protein
VAFTGGIVIAFALGSWTSATVGAELQLQVGLDGVAQSPLLPFSVDVGSNYSAWHCVYIGTPAAGNHTFTVMQSGGAVSVTVYDGRLIVIELKA